MSYSIILPTFNEKNHITDLIKAISNIFISRNISYEILIVDDNSTDGTKEKVNEFAINNKYLKLILRKNKKRNLADSINDGIKKSMYNNIIWMDADFQHPPKYISRLIDLSSMQDVVICSRFLKESKRYFNEENFAKDINENQSQFYNKFCKFFLYKDITDYTSGYIFIKKNFITNYNLIGFYGDYFVNLICYLKNKKVKINEIAFKDGPRASGTSKTLVNINFKYSYLCLRYFLTFIKNLLIKNFSLY